MLVIDDKGKVINPKIKDAISPLLEHGAMPKVKGIIVHQTDSSTAASTLAKYKQPKAEGAHFLIDKDGTIYQTASVLKRTYHVGRLRSRCLAEMKCSPSELKVAKKWSPAGTNEREQKKSVPDRYPSNDDGIGIEIVGKSFPLKENPNKKVYEDLTAAQQQSLKWLITELRATLNVPLTEIFRHPTVSHKTETEAASAQW
jgi:N-acetyl-anhydromuramyl-L-alanine amidase AmpD